MCVCLSSPPRLLGRYVCLSMCCLGGGEEKKELSLASLSLWCKTRLLNSGGHRSTLLAFDDSGTST